VSDQPDQADRDLPEDAGAPAADPEDGQAGPESHTDKSAPAVASGDPQFRLAAAFTPLHPKVDFTPLFPKVDFTPLFPKVDFTPLYPKVDFTPLFPKVDFTPLYPKVDFTPLYPKVDFAALYPKLDFMLPKLTLGPAVTRILEALREKYPPNWPTDIDIDKVTSVIQDEGLPIVWVPRAELVEMLLAVEDRSARVDVLLDHVPEFVADCRSVLSQVSHITLNKQVSLASRALEAFEAGHHEAAQALAVTVTETAVARALVRQPPFAS
jgi:hypothetical protein